MECFGCHDIFGTAEFPLWHFVYIVTCYYSLPPPPPPPNPHPGSKLSILQAKKKLYQSLLDPFLNHSFWTFFLAHGKSNKPCARTN